MRTFARFSQTVPPFTPSLESAMSADLEHIRQIMREADCLYTEAEVEAAIARVGAQINDQLAESNPVVFCVMNGGLIFSGKLLTHLNFPLEASYLHATRYRNETSGGDLFWKAKPEVSFIDRDVLIIDDILDEGHTFYANSRGTHLLRLVVDAAGRRVTRQERLLDGTFGRLRDVVVGPDGYIYISTNNRDGRGSPAAADDRIIRLSPAP